MEVDLAMQVVVWVLGGDWAKALLRRGEKPNRRIGGSRRDRRLGSRVSGSHKVVSPRGARGYLPIEMVYRSQARPVGMRRPGERRGGGREGAPNKNDHPTRNEPQTFESREARAASLATAHERRLKLEQHTGDADLR